MKALEFVIWLLVTIILATVIVYGYLSYEKIDNTNTEVTQIRIDVNEIARQLEIDLSD